MGIDRSWGRRWSKGLETFSDASGEVPDQAWAAGWDTPMSDVETACDESSRSRRKSS